MDPSRQKGEQRSGKPLQMNGKQKLKTYTETWKEENENQKRGARAKERS